MTIKPGRRPTARTRDLAVMFRSLSTLLQAGLPLERALAATEPIVPVVLRELLSRARARLTEGASLAAALGTEPSPVPDSAIALLRAGERAGRLANSLDVVASSLEQEAELRARIHHALAYPAVLALGGTASIGVIVVVVIPRFASMLEDVGQVLPPSTALLLALSGFLARWWIALVAVSIGACSAFVTWIRTPGGTRTWHEWLLGLPGIGGIRANLGAASALNALYAALEAGMPLVPALALAREATSDAAISSRFHATSELLLQGSPFATSLAVKRAVPDLAVQLLAIGESSGQLGAMADRASRLMSQDAERRLATAVRLLEPALIVVFGGIIALVAGALLQAVYSLRPVGA
jgi:type II secretory pathway component PulF